MWVLSDERGSPYDVKLFPAFPAGLVLAILDEEAVIQKHADPIPIKYRGVITKSQYRVFRGDVSSRLLVHTV